MIAILVVTVVVFALRCDGRMNAFGEMLCIQDGIMFGIFMGIFANVGYIGCKQHC